MAIKYTAMRLVLSFALNYHESSCKLYFQVYLILISTFKKKLHTHGNFHFKTIVQLDMAL